MCRNGEYTERGIKQIDGFMSERWRIEPEYAMKIDRSLGLLGVLLEPTTVVTKAWEQLLAVGACHGVLDRLRCRLRPCLIPGRPRARAVSGIRSGRRPGLRSGIRGSEE